MAPFSGSLSIGNDFAFQDHPTIGKCYASFQFEWDDPKAAANLRKRGVSFELASTIFGDPRILTLADTTHSEREERWFSIGLVSTGTLMSVACLWTAAGGQIKIRLITARRATATEIRYYTEGQ